MICKQCGCEILNDSQFCENCGTKVDRPAPAPVEAPAQTAVPAPDFQPIQVVPVYPSNSIYARNAAAAQQVVMQPVPVQSQFVPPQPYQPAPAQSQLVPPQPYQPAPVYYTYAAPAEARNTFSKVIRIVSGVAMGIYAFILLYFFVSDKSEAAEYMLVLMLAGFSVFTFIYSSCKRTLGKGAFFGFLIPNCVILYMALSLIGLS